MQNPLQEYLDLVERWRKLRVCSLGMFTDEELPLMDEMTPVWNLLSADERVEAEKALEKVPGPDDTILDSERALAVAMK